MQLNNLKCDFFVCLCIWTLVFAGVVALQISFLSETLAVLLKMKALVGSDSPGTPANGPSKHTVTKEQQ